MIWCGDFNYRIDLPGDEVKATVLTEDWNALLEKDQLRVSIKNISQKIFDNLIFNSLNINFMILTTMKIMQSFNFRKRKSREMRNNC